MCACFRHGANLIFALEFWGDVQFYPKLSFFWLNLFKAFDIESDLPCLAENIKTIIFNFLQ